MRLSFDPLVSSNIMNLKLPKTLKEAELLAERTRKTAQTVFRVAPSAIFIGLAGFGGFLTPIVFDRAFQKYNEPSPFSALIGITSAYIAYRSCFPASSVKPSSAMNKSDRTKEALLKAWLYQTQALALYFFISPRRLDLGSAMTFMGMGFSCGLLRGYYGNPTLPGKNVVDKPLHVVVSQPKPQVVWTEEDKKMMRKLGSDLLASIHSGVTTGLIILGGFMTTLAISFVLDLDDPWGAPRLGPHIPEGCILGSALVSSLMTYRSRQQAPSIALPIATSKRPNKTVEAVKEGLIYQAWSLPLYIFSYELSQRDSRHDEVSQFGLCVFGLCVSGLAFVYGFARMYLKLALEEGNINTKSVSIKLDQREPLEGVKKKEGNKALLNTFHLVLLGMIHTLSLAKIFEKNPKIFASLKGRVQNAYDGIKETYDRIQNASQKAYDVIKENYDRMKEEIDNRTHTEITELRTYGEWQDQEREWEMLEDPSKYLETLSKKFENLSEEEMFERYKCADILGTYSIDPTDITSHKKRYKKLSLMVHPDKDKGASKAQEVLNRANEEMRKTKLCSKAMAKADDPRLLEEIQKRLVIPGWLPYLWGERSTCWYDTLDESLNIPLVRCQDLIEASAT